MTQEQQAKAVEILGTIGTIAAGVGTIAGGPTGAVIAVTTEIITTLTETVLKLANGEEPTDDELAAADRARIAANVRMNTAVDARLDELEA